MTGRIIDHICAALRAAGPDGLTVVEIAEAATLSRGTATSRELTRKTIAKWNAAAGSGPTLCVDPDERPQRWRLLADVADPSPLAPPDAAGPGAPPMRLLAWPSSVTAALMGDPLPGRSAYDARRSRTGVDQHA